MTETGFVLFTGVCVLLFISAVYWITGLGKGRDK